MVEKGIFDTMASAKTLRRNWKMALR